MVLKSIQDLYTFYLNYHQNWYLKQCGDNYLQDNFVNIGMKCHKIIKNLPFFNEHVHILFLSPKLSREVKRTMQAKNFYGVMQEKNHCHVSKH